MQLSSEAENHLRVIRAMMEKGVVYRAMSAPTALAGGIFSMIAAAALEWGPWQGPRVFLAGWGTVLALTLAVNTAVVVREARMRGGPLVSPAMRTAFCAMFPPLAAGGVFTFWIGRASTEDSMLFVVLWAVFYGLALLAGISFAPRSMAWLGAVFLVFGLALFSFSCAAESHCLPPNRAMAASFGLFHLIYAAAPWPRHARLRQTRQDHP
jgi:hypothetical protein